jgi:valyl-tRNA synthetase
VLQLLLNADPLEVDPAFTGSKGTLRAATPIGDLFLPLEGLIDLDAERDRLAKEIAKVDQELVKVGAKLANETFVQGAPAKVVEEHRERQAAWLEKLAQLRKMREDLG